jgi:glycerophosphoryl diester phosphodiesterase
VRPIVIAHRTCPRDAPENSLAGIALAGRLGADAVEVDVRLSSDGVPYLLHDRRLLRTTGRPARIDRTPSSVLRAVRLRGGPSVPSFAEALDALPDGLMMAIDVKDPFAAGAVVAEIRNQDAASCCLFWSQHDTAVALAVEQLSEVESALLRDTSSAEATAAFVADARRLGARAISAHWSQVGPDLAERCERSGLRLYAWCKRRTIDCTKLRLLAGLVTDWPVIGAAHVTSLER